jgi:hypothetical protein
MWRRLRNIILSVEVIIVSKICIQPTEMDGTIIYMASTAGKSQSSHCNIFTHDDLNSAYAAYVSGILINVVGFAGASKLVLFSNHLMLMCFFLAGRHVPLVATRIYQMSFFTGFGVSALMYYFLSTAFPPAGKCTSFNEVDVSGTMGGTREDERTNYGDNETNEETETKETNSIQQLDEFQAVKY